MKPRESSPQSSDLFRHRIDEIINMTHPLVKLAQLIDWVGLRAQMGSAFSERQKSSGQFWSVGGGTDLLAAHVQLFG
ncbi:MAG: hypothetical protein FWG81_11730 [Betaproteobacteria bacterium]|nr:hypothetical protein [Betaproteobacteria bacterium]